MRVNTSLDSVVNIQPWSDVCFIQPGHLTTHSFTINMPITVDITQKPGFLNTTPQTLDLFVLSGARVHTQMGPLQKGML